MGMCIPIKLIYRPRTYIWLVAALCSNWVSWRD
jgi:hypothetical protein